MKDRLLVQVLPAALTLLGVTAGLGWLLSSIRRATVAAVETSSPAAALVAIAASMWAVVFLLPFALALGGWLVVGAVWISGRLAPPIARCLRRPRVPRVVRLGTLTHDDAAARAA